ncbi:esterase-like activity of phytase family protein [Solwaraspora sp. WMMD937]|uniref:esterase-like activity of phytase family protein n=1 Tax=Solwaraspora sp. WMMD937 TaxID=3016090 RepID=UPI00249B094C|nr:esterase-like activity of phytase family protein [Solwaraspora sp. WMMD937]WFE22391.1 esterase-like activity of phytase family protein [Solwaraspora sp. WMMD937]
MRTRRSPAVLVTTAATAAVLCATVALTVMAPGGAAAGHRDDRPGWPGSAVFGRTATYPVFHNRPAGEDPSAETVAEISTVSPDGRTMIYTDAAGRRVGFLDITDPRNPRGLGTLSLATLGNAEDEPTSVAVVGRYVLIVVNTSASYTTPSGRLDVVDLATRTRVRSIPLGGQPDAIEVSDNGRYAAIAIENERDEEATPLGGDEGDLPQPPAGFLQIVDLTGRHPATWSTRTVSLTAADGSALPGLVTAGLDTPADPEPEYVSINGRDQVAVTLQENNGVILVDLRSGRITKAFGAGTATVTGIDTADDGVIDLTGTITDLPREPDAVAWIDDRYLATANEGDWKGGTRGWSIFDSRTGRVVWDAGNSIEQLAVRHGLHNDNRADNKGAEPEGIAVATFGRTRYAFVGSERSNFVAVYDLTRPTSPVLRQVLATTNGPEGLLPIPARGLLAVSSEVDDAEAGVRAAVNLYRLGADTPSFPTLVSQTSGRGPDRAPIGWGGLGALTAVPGKRHQLFAASDALYSPTRIYTIDTRHSPARIIDDLVVRDASGEPAGYDAEGLFARPQGGFWLVSEGATGAANQLVRLDRSGVTRQVVSLPDEVAAGLGSQGLEGVTALTDRRGREQVWVVLQRGVASDPAGVVRLGRYDVRGGTWAWFGYRLESTDVAGDWIGLSEIASVGDGRLAVIERDKLSGPAARVKRIYTVDLPTGDPAPGLLPVLPKRLAYDVLPDLQAGNGWTQEKLEGLAVGGNRQVYMVTDNDGAQDATGETVFLRLGSADRVFGRGRR